MMTRASIKDAEKITEMRIMLLKETAKYGEEYNWHLFSDKLNKYYKSGYSDGSVVTYFESIDDKIIGVCTMCFYNICPLLSNVEGKMALISDMFVLPEYRKRGVGKSLLAVVMEYAKEMSYPKVVLNATNDGRRMYEKYGFTQNDNEMLYKF